MTEHTPNSEGPSATAAKKKLRIVLGLPEWLPFQQVMSHQPADATYVIQANLSRGLTARGHAVTFVAPNGVEDLIVATDPGRATVAARTWSARLPFRVAAKLAWRLQNLLGVPYLNVFSNYRFLDAAQQALKGVDVIYERNGLYNAALATMARRLRVPYVMFFEADQIMELDLMGRPITGLLRWRANQLLRYNLNVADCVISVTDAGRRRLVNRWHVPPSKILVFPNAVDVDRFRPDVEAANRTRATLGLREEPIVMFVGNFFQWHDVITLLRAFARALRSCPNARLIMVGDGERRAETMKNATDLGVGHATRFTGILPHADVPQYIAAADIAVVPYPPMQQDMWLSPLKLFEYMSSGAAVVASAVGQITDVLRDRENGLLVPPGDVAALSDALVELLAAPGLRSRLGMRARQDAVQRYSWARYLDRLERVFEVVIARQQVDSI